MLHNRYEGPQADGVPSGPHARQVEVTHALAPDDAEFLASLDRQHRQFLEHAEYVLNHSKTTLRIYVIAYSCFRNFLVGPSRGQMELRARMFLLDAWVLWNRKRGLSPITTNSYWRALRPFFNYLERTEGFQNPYKGAKAPRFQAPLPKALKAADLLRLLDAARSYPWTTAYLRERAVALIGVMIYAGLRRSEVLKLQFADIDLAQGTIRIIKGKGRFGGKDRTAYINADLRAILSSFLRERQRAGFICPELFASREKRGLSLEQFKRVMLLIKRASGVTFTPHSLRHSFITMLLRSGVPINAVQELAGHASINTTAGYLRLWDEDKKTQINKLRLQ
jgi:site-specific recombinase XerD